MSDLYEHELPSPSVNIDWQFFNQSLNNDLTDEELRMCTSVNSISEAPYLMCLMSNGVFGIVHEEDESMNCFVIGKINLSLSKLVKEVMPFYNPDTTYLPSKRNDSDLMAGFLYSNNEIFEKPLCDAMIRLARAIIVNSKDMSKAFHPDRLSLINNILKSRIKNGILN